MVEMISFNLTAIGVVKMIARPFEDSWYGYAMNDFTDQMAEFEDK